MAWWRHKANSARRCPVLADGVAPALVAAAATHRLGYSLREDPGIEVWAHALHDLALEEGVGLGLAAQYVPLLLGGRLSASLTLRGSFLCATWRLPLAAGPPPSTPPHHLGHPPPVTLPARRAHPLPAP